MHYAMTLSSCARRKRRRRANHLLRPSAATTAASLLLMMACRSTTPPALAAAAAAADPCRSPSCFVAPSLSSSSPVAAFSSSDPGLLRRASLASRIAARSPLDVYVRSAPDVLLRAMPPSRVRLYAQDDEASDASNDASTTGSTRERIRSVRGKVKNLANRAKSLVKKPKASSASGGAVPDPRDVAKLLEDAAVGTVELAVEEVLTPAMERIEALTDSARNINGRSGAKIHRGHAFTTSDVARTHSVVERVERSAAAEGEAAAAIDAVALAKTTASDAFASAEDAIREAETALEGARMALMEAKAEAAEAISAAEEAAALASEAASRATALATETAVTGAVAAPVESPAVEEEEATTTTKTAVVGSEATAMETAEDVAVSTLGYEDVGYHLSEMAPPFIGEDQCLVPGEAVVRVEKAPDNSRRIFAGIDIVASVDDVWKVLTNYHKLQEVVPNLVVNEVLETYESDASAPSNAYDPNKPDEAQCKEISTHMRGAKLRQVGGAKVVGINFSARTTLEVREWPQGMPDFAHYADEVYEGKSRDKRAREGKGLKLKRYRFPRPFALSSLPTRDISMQSVEDDDGEFRMYQGVWRMQPLPGCVPPPEQAMRLTYAVEISPRPYLPVALVEGRIAQDLCTNLRAIRDHVST